MLALSSTNRVALTGAVLDAARPSFVTIQPRLAIAELRAWREIATAAAAGLGKKSVKWLEDPSEVARPSQSVGWIAKGGLNGSPSVAKHGNDP